MLEVISDASLPGSRLQPTLKQAASSLSAPKGGALQPDDLAMWVRGGRLLSDELGLYMDALNGGKMHVIMHQKKSHRLLSKQLFLQIWDLR